MSDKDAMDQMKYDIQYLASDRLEGRNTASPGEKLASEYIIGKFGNVGLMPYGDSATYLQAFTFAAPPVLGKTNILSIGRNTLKLGADFYPISYSANDTVFTRVARCKYGILAPEMNRNDFDGVDVKDHAAAFCISSPDGIHPHSKWITHNDLRGRIDDAIKLGANAILLYNDDATADDPDSTLRAKIQPCAVPVVFLTKKGFENLGLDGNPVVVQVGIVHEQKVGHNVVGFLDNGKPNVVVIGAHYDHLGWGDEGSLYRGGPAIHNGADDNASGVAAMMQLARDISVMPEAHNNDYLFIAFSGEEKGLYGSNWWTKHPTVPLNKLTYMVNLDMVGRMDSTRDMIINGTGTSPTWDSVITAMRHPKRLRPDLSGLKTRPSRSDGDTLHLKLSAGGVGPSDQTSFYLQGVPAIHFFTGAHEDYHKPSDDEDKINYPGMLRVVRYIESLITKLDADAKLTFTKTADTDTSETPRFTVTLGVVPDYMYEGKGMRIDGVTDGKTAAAAGLKTGDVVIKLGDHDTADMMSYMKALGMFKKGDKTNVTVLREGKEMKVDITFK